MNKKFWTGCVVVFVVIGVFEFIVHGLLLGSTYQEESMRHLWRPQAEMKLGLLYVVYAFIAYFFTLILSKGYEGKGVMEGVRYGFYVGMLMAVPMAYATYATMPISYSLALQWFIYGVIEYIIAGVAAALVLGKQATVTQAPKTS